MATITLTNNLEVNDLTIDAGDVLVTDGYDIVVHGNFVLNGTLNATNGTGGNTAMSLAGNWTTGAAGAFTNTNSTVTFDGGAAVTQTIDMYASSLLSFNNVVFAGTGTTTFLMSPSGGTVGIQVDGTTILNQGILDFNDNNATLTGNVSVETIGTGPTQINSGTGTVSCAGNVDLLGIDVFAHENGTWKFAKTSATQTIDTAGVTFYAVTFDGADKDTVTYQLLDNLIADSTVTLNQGTLDFNDNDATLNGNFTVADGNTTNLLSGTGTITAKGDVSLSALEAFAHENGTWVFAKTSGTQTIATQPNSYPFYNVDFNGAAASSVTYQITTNPFNTAVGSTINLYQGKLDLNDQNATINGDLVVGATASTNILSGTGTVYLNGSTVDLANADLVEGEGGTWSIQSGGATAFTPAPTGMNLSNLEVTGASVVTVSGTMTAGTLGDLLMRTGTFDVNDNDITINTFLDSNEGTTEFDSGTGTVTATGDVNFTNLDTFAHENGTWEFVDIGATDALLITCGAVTFYDVTFDGTDATALYQLAEQLTLDHDFTLNGGTFDINSQEVNGVGNFTVGNDSASALIGGGTYRIEGNVDMSNLDSMDTGGTWYLDGSSTQDADFNSFTMTSLYIQNTSAIVTLTESFTTTATNSISAGAYVKFGAGKTFTFANLTWNGAGGNFITLRSTTDGVQWDLTTNSTETVSYIDVQDSNSTAFQIDATNNGIDAGNNVNWLFGTQVRYWVGGSGTDNNWSNENNWSNASGGSGGYTVPANSDTVYFDANSGACDLDMNVIDSNKIGIWNCTGYTDTFTGTGYTMEIAGDLTLAVGMTFVAPDDVIFHKHSSTMIIISAGKTFNDVNFGHPVEAIPEGTDEVWSITSNFTTTTTSTVTLNYGTLSMTGTATLICGNFRIGVISTDVHTVAINAGTGMILRPYLDCDLRDLDTLTGPLNIQMYTASSADLYTDGFSILSLAMYGAGTLNLRDAVTTSGTNTTVNFSTGTVNTNNFNITMGGTGVASWGFETGSGTVLNLGSSIITLSPVISGTTNIMNIRTSSLTAGTSQLILAPTGSGTAQVLADSKSFYDVTVNAGVTTQFYPGNPGFTVTNMFLMKAGTFSTNNQNFTLNDFTADDTGTTSFSSGSSTVTVTGDVNFTNLDTFTSSTSTWKFTKSSDTAQLTSAGKSFYNVTCEVNAAATLQFQDAFTSTNVVTLNSGTLDTQSVAVNLSQFTCGDTDTTVLTLGSSTVTSTSHVNFTNLDTLTAGTSRWIFAASSGTQLVTSASKNFNYITFNASGAITQLQDNMRSNGYSRNVNYDDVLISAGTLDLNDFILRVQGSLKATAGTVDSGTGKIIMLDGGAEGENINSVINLGNLQIGE